MGYVVIRELLTIVCLAIRQSHAELCILLASELHRCATLLTEIVALVPHESTRESSRVLTLLMYNIPRGHFDHRHNKIGHSG